MTQAMFNIAAVERDTGLSKDVLRVWERRYGFPSPQRDAGGERLYSADQVERLRLIKRLMDQGHRPGRLLAAPAESLATLEPRRTRSDSSVVREREEDGIAELLGMIRRHDVEAYRQTMQQGLARDGLQRFVQRTVAPITRAVGEAWEAGNLEVYEEHLFTELTKRLLRQAIAALPADGKPRILLTTLPEEQHALGLLMVEALFALEGAQCIPLGIGTPLLDVARAAEAHGVDVVALSFSSAFPRRQVSGLLQQLRVMLPPPVALWAGGAGVSRIAAIDGVRLLNSLEDAVAALAEWRAARA